MKFQIFTHIYLMKLEVEQFGEGITDPRLFARVSNNQRHFGEPLPAIRVPLRIGESDADFDLQPLVNQCYKNGPYGMLPYQKSPTPKCLGLMKNGPCVLSNMKIPKSTTAAPAPWSSDLRTRGRSHRGTF